MALWQVLFEKLRREEAAEKAALEHCVPWHQQPEFLSKRSKSRLKGRPPPPANGGVKLEDRMHEWKVQRDRKIVRVLLPPIESH